MLLSLNEISNLLDARFSPFDGDMDYLMLKHGGADINTIKNIESALNIVFPKDFKFFLVNYDLNNFSLGSITFGNGDCYIEKIRQLNTENELSQWWGEGKRPSDLLVIAYNDPYTVFLNAKNGEVYAATSESGFRALKPVAKNFTLFFRGVASVFLGHLSVSSVEIETGSESKGFWGSMV